MHLCVLYCDHFVFLCLGHLFSYTEAPKYHKTDWCKNQTSILSTIGVGSNEITQEYVERLSNTESNHGTTYTQTVCKTGLL